MEVGSVGRYGALGKRAPSLTGANPVEALEPEAARLLSDSRVVVKGEIQPWVPIGHYILGVSQNALSNASPVLAGPASGNPAEFIR